MALIIVIAFLTLLAAGRDQIAKGANAQVANGAVMLTLAAVVGALALGVVLSLDVW